MFKPITYFTDDSSLIELFNQYQKIVSTLFKAKIFLYEDCDNEYPDRKFIVCEIQKPFPEGIIFVTMSSDIDKVLRNIEEFIEY